MSLAAPRAHTGGQILAGLAVALVACLMLALPARAAPTFPAFTGLVVDDAHILPPDAQADLTQRLQALQSRTSRQLVVVTLPSLQGYDIADYGYQLGRTWGVGQKGTNNGALFIIVPAEHKVRIEVGYGLEGVLTDAITSVIIQREVVPRFRAGDTPGGVVAGTQAIIDQLGADTSTAEQKAAQAAADLNAQQQQANYSRRHGNPLGGIVALFIIVWVIGGVLGGRAGGFGWFLPGLILGSLTGGRRDDDWGGGGGFGGGGGGFSGGGGGSFGGGGSSGSW